MHNSTTPSVSLSQALNRSAVRLMVPLLGFIIGWGGVLYASGARAASPDSAPAELKSTLTQLDAAANSKNIQAVMAFYSPNFTHADGLTRQTLETNLSQLWQRYPQLQYRTELKSWDKEGEKIVAETVTYITGTQPIDGRDVKLESTLHSRQRFEGTKLVQQEILSERTRMTSGAKPPTVELKLPEQVRIGQSYNLDAIVQEPLGDDLMLGAAMEEPVQADRFAKPGAISLEVLPAGGIYKMGRAPLAKGNYWVSTVLVREGGMTMITQRLRVLEGEALKK